MKFDPGLLDEIKDRVNIVEIIDKTTPLKRNGRNYEACCPFHEEKTPSFKVREDKQFYNCFGCGEKGDVFDWLQNQQGLTFVEAVKELASISGTQLPETKKQSDEETEKSKNAFSLGYKLQGILRKSFKETSLKLPFGTEVSDTLQLGRATNGRLVNGTLKKYKELLDLSALRPDRKTGRPGIADENGLITPLTTRKGAITGFVFFDPKYRPTVMPIHPSYNPDNQWLNNSNIDRNQSVLVAYDFPTFVYASKAQQDAAVVLEPASKTQLSEKQLKGIMRSSDDVSFCLPKHPQREASAIYSLLKAWEPERVISVIDQANLCRGSTKTTSILDHLVSKWSSYSPEAKEKLGELLSEKGLSVVHYIAQNKDAIAQNQAVAEQPETPRPPSP